VRKGLCAKELDMTLKEFVVWARIIFVLPKQKQELCAHSCADLSRREKKRRYGTVGNPSKEMVFMLFRYFLFLRSERPKQSFREGSAFGGTWPGVVNRLSIKDFCVVDMGGIE